MEKKTKNNQSKIDRREFLKKLAKKAIYIPPIIITFKARKARAPVVTAS